MTLKELRKLWNARGDKKLWVRWTAGDVCRDWTEVVYVPRHARLYLVSGARHGGARVPVRLADTDEFIVSDKEPSDGTQAKH